jgi:hypothetical protein
VEKHLQQALGSIPSTTKINKFKPGAVGHAYNPSYQGGRNQEDLNLRPAQAKSLQDAISTNKNLDVVVQCLGSQLYGKCKKDCNTGQPWA